MKKRILCLVLALLMVFSIIPPQTFAVDVETTTTSDTVVEKLAKVTTSFGEARKNLNESGNIVTYADYPELVVIKKVVIVGNDTWYQLYAAEGYTWPDNSRAADGWYIQSTKVAVRCDKCGGFGCEKGHENWCGICGKDDCGIIHDACGICGGADCTKLHFYCELCGKYDCGKGHLYCLACGEMDCTENHVFCGTCGKYDCGQTHEDVYKPATAPAIPQNPTLTPGAEVSVVDEYGDSVADGLTLIAGTKTSISAWPNAGTGASYQWQVCVDDKWIDIHGQNRQGLLISPAMVLSAMSGEEAQVRCQVTVDGETKTSAAIPVSVVVPESMATYARTASGAAAANAAALAAQEDENKVNVIIHYVFTNNAIAANPWAATLPKGVAYSTGDNPITVPVIAGYAPSLGDGVDTTKVTLSADGKLSLNFTAEDLAANQTINIVYQPAPVKVVVNHHWQNVADDNYTLHETVQTTAVTGTKLGDVHKSYEGFYNLLYEHPTVAADGSTVVDVYYDRYYYLMTFDLSGGYGMDAIYARYGATIPLATMGEPTRPGYTLTGWTLDGRPAAVMSTMPARNTTFVAVWSGEMTTYDVVFWYENADNDKYAQAGVLENVEVLAGTVVNGSDYKNTNFDGRDATHFTFSHADENVIINGDGSTVINVYFSRNVYTLTFVMGDMANGCTVPIHASHTDYTGDCYTLACDKAHIHDDSCHKTLVCQIDPHEHTDECLKCGLSIHTEHTASCLTCQITEHTHSNACCTVPVHTHTPSNCCSIPAHSHGEACCVLEPHEHTYDRREGSFFQGYTYYGGCYPANGGTQPTCGQEAHTHRTGYGSSCTCDQEAHTHAYSYNNNYYGCNTEKCGLAEHNHSSGCVYCSKNLTEHTHSEENNCYSDVIHTTHTESCYDHPAHTHDEKCYTYQCGVLEHTHTDTCYELVCDHLHYHSGSTCYLVIIRKYDADISDVWKENPVKAVIDDGDAFTWNQTNMQVSFMEKMPGVNSQMSKYNYSGSNTYHWFYYLEVLPGVDTTGLTTRTYNGKVYVEYDDSTINTSRSLSLTYDDDYYPITGFDQLYKKGEGGWNRDSDGIYKYSFSYDSDSEEYRAYLYYTRNKYNLSFSNHGTVVAGKGGDFYYQADISGQYFVPDYPSTLEPDVYRFEGWYTSPFFGDTKYEFTTTDEDGNVVKATMPAESIRLYAHWVPVSRTVRFFLDEADMKAGVVIPDRMDALWEETHGGQSNPNSPYVKFNTRTNVPNKSFLSEIDTPGVSDGYDNHPYKGYTFIGWFYMDNGVEKAFDPKNMPVTQDMDLYGKWSSNVLCPYEIRFVLDENGNGVLDAGETTFVADSITGSTLAGNSRTFNAKGDTALYAGYQSGYYPNVASHTIDFKASDESGVVYTFLYKQGDSVPYTVKYLEKGSNKELAVEVTYPNNQKAVVTENFKPIPGYMPDAFQKTLVVVPGSAGNVITFYYTVDTVHAPYQVKHYVQTLDGTGWIEYRSADFTGDIGKIYQASPITITGFTFSAEKTEEFNIDQKINGYDGSKLPGAVSFDGDTVSGELTGNGMQLNLYYTRNTHTYKVQYLEYGTDEVLEEEKVVTNVFYGTIATENAINIRRDMDGDGLFDDFQLYEATAPSQSATITDDSKVFVFYYVRCTGEELSVTKTLTGSPSEDISFNFTLTSTATDFAEISNGTYAYEIKTGTTSVEKGYKSVANGNTITFSLKGGQTITFFGMPTAVYTVTEHALPLGYYETSSRNQQVTLTKDAKANITVTNEYAPAALEVTKKVNRIENVTDNVTDFEFYITVPSAVTGTYSYTVGTASRNVTVVDGKMTITLRDGETALFANLPAGIYTVAEKNYTSEGYSAVYVDNDNITSDGVVTLVKGQKASVLCTNSYPVGSLTITKTVNKAYANDEWTGDTFVFTIERTDGELNSPSYPVYSGTTKIGDATVNADRNLVVEIAFTALGTKTIKIDNLPKGQYTVTEAEDAEYTQSARTVNTSISPEDYAGKAEFTNTFKKHLGDLTITKNVDALPGHTAPEDAVFTFQIGGTALRKSSYHVVVSDSKGVVGSAECSTINGSLTLKLEGGQTAVIKDLALDYYSITEQVDDRFVMTASSGTNGAINAEDTAKAEFTNTYVPRGNLQVAKYIDRDVYQNIQINTEQEFTFIVKLDYPLDRQETYTAKIYTADAGEPAETIRLTGKTLTFKLKHDQYIIIEDLPAVSYTIEEAEVEGYRTPYFMGNASGTVPVGGTEVVYCYNPVELVPGDLQITKIINDTTYNSSAPRDLPFEFAVTLNYITEPKNLEGIYRVEYNCDPNKGTLTEVKTGDVVTGYRYTPNGGVADELPATVRIEPGMDSEYGFTLELYDGMTATIKDLPPSAYHVKEKDYSEEGFAADWTGNVSGLLGGALVDGKNPLESLTCTNTYPVNKNGEVIIRKQVTKDYIRDVLPGDVFKFKVTPTDGNILEGDYRVTITGVNVETIATTTTATAITDDNGTYLLVEIPFTAAELVMELNDSRTKTLTIEGLPLGQYQVEETADDDYRQNPEQTPGTFGQSVYVGTNPGDVTFINRYKRHLGNIQITKKLAEGSEDDGSDFLFHILDSEGHVVMSVTLKAGETKTIWDLPVGVYTVREDTSWNWRYTLKSGNDVVADLNQFVTADVTFVNHYSENKWINYICNFMNEFAASK